MLGAMAARWRSNCTMRRGGSGWTSCAANGPLLASSAAQVGELTDPVVVRVIPSEDAKTTRQLQELRCGC